MSLGCGSVASAQVENLVQFVAWKDQVYGVMPPEPVVVSGTPMEIQWAASANVLLITGIAEKVSVSSLSSLVENPLVQEPRNLTPAAWTYRVGGSGTPVRVIGLKPDWWTHLNYDGTIVWNIRENSVSGYDAATGKQIGNPVSAESTYPSPHKDILVYFEGGQGQRRIVMHSLFRGKLWTAELGDKEIRVEQAHWDERNSRVLVDTNKGVLSFDIASGRRSTVSVSELEALTIVDFRPRANGPLCIFESMSSRINSVADPGTTIGFTEAVRYSTPSSSQPDPAWLKARQTAAFATLPQESSYAALSPKQDFVAWLMRGMICVSKIEQVPRSVYDNHLLQVAKREAIMTAKQAGLALIMFASDNDDNLPAVEGFESKVMPYVRDAQVLKRFVYTNGNLNISEIKDPAGTVLGHVDGPGGRAVVFADGHVKWIPDNK